MKQVYVQSTSNVPSNTVTTYTALCASSSNGLYSTTENETTVIAPTAGTFRNLVFYAGANAGTGNSWAITARKNGADTALTLTISGATSSNSDLVNSFTVAAGDVVNLKIVPTSTPTNMSNPSWTVEFEPSTANKCVLMSKTRLSISTSARTYMYPNGIEATGESTLANANIVIPHACTLNAIYAEATVAPGSGKNYTISIYKNAAEEASTQFTIADTATTGNITGLSLSLSAGDLICLSTLPSGTPAATIMGFGILLDSGNDTDSIVGINSGGALGTITSYSSINGRGTNTTEAAANGPTGPTGYVLKNLYVKLATAPGSGKTRTFTNRINAGAGNSTTTISDTTTTGSDTSNTTTYASGDVIGYSMSQTGTATSSYATMSFTQTISSGGETVVKDMVCGMIPFAR